MKQNTNLLAQFGKVQKHNRQNSYKTRERYAHAFKRFLSFLYETFHLQNIKNIKPKHLFCYMEYMQQKGNAPRTIKTELSAIRFWHDQIPGVSCQLPSNDDLNAERRSFGGVDRTWFKEEFQQILAAVAANKTATDRYYAEILTIALYSGARIHEVFRIDTAIARSAIKSGTWQIKGKGGKDRNVPLSREAEDIFLQMLGKTPEGSKLFVTKDDKTHLAINRFQVALGRIVKNLYPNRNTSLTVHGLRHTWTAKEYSKLIGVGYSESRAKKRTSKWLGHEREDVTNIYLASLDKDEVEED